MKIRFRHLRLRAETEIGTYGVDIPFSAGLNVLWADNTKGKSTCLQGLLYALGLEKMLSPRREIPLPYVMTSHLDDTATGKHHNVLQSSVSVEIENSQGAVISVKRDVVSSTDRKLVSVFFGPSLSQPEEQFHQSDFFVLDPGAAQREAGFHRFLAEFIGWKLPTVRRFDGSETQLYLETIFPLVYVEQKAGWSALPAALPGYFQIRDVARRSVEFLIGLNTHEIERRRQQLDMDLAASRSAWSTKTEELSNIASSAGGRPEGLPLLPTISDEEIDRAFIAIPDDGGWKAAESIEVGLRAKLADLRAVDVPSVSAVADEASAELERLNTEYSERNARRAALFRARQTEIAQRTSARRRMAALEEDLQKNLDAQKLRNLGSSLSVTLSADHCPTCTQPIADTLLAQRAGTLIMPVEDNIEYIKAQRGIFQKLDARANEAIDSLDVEILAEAAKLTEISARIRALRADLIAPSSLPSTADLEQRIRLEAKIQTLDEAQQRFEMGKDALKSIGARYGELLASLRSLPADRYSDADKRKIDAFTSLLREQVALYGFTTFPPLEIDVSLDNYRPQKEGFEIGFELSASDAIRLKWAYQLALLELDRTTTTSHPGFLVFDEPRQQETAKVSFKSLLQRASSAGSAGQQVIFATSEDREQLVI